MCGYFFVFLYFWSRLLEVKGVDVFVLFFCLIGRRTTDSTQNKDLIFIFRVGKDGNTQQLGQVYIEYVLGPKQVTHV